MGIYYNKHKPFPLIESVIDNDVDFIDLFLKDENGPSGCSSYLGLALLYACENRNIEIAKMLLDAKADINYSKYDRNSALFIACIKNDINMMRLLFEYNPDINIINRYGDTILMCACKNNNIDIVKLLFCHKFSKLINHVNYIGINGYPNRRRPHGYNCMHIACKSNNIDIVKLLIEKGANINHPFSYNVSCLTIAYLNNNTKLVKLLIDNGADINFIPADEWFMFENIVKRNNDMQFIYEKNS